MPAKEKSIFDLVEFPFGRHLTAVTKLYVGALKKRFEHLDIERYYSVLILIENTKTTCTQQYIADTLQKDKTSMVGIVDSLVKKGYIRRVKNPSDRREHIIKLTTKAIQVLPEIHKGIMELNAIATKGLSKREVKTFHQHLELMAANLAKEPSYPIVANFEKVKQD
jgi:MarR family transcriptional regulator, transcriptional regulator for hemolysin